MAEYSEGIGSTDVAQEKSEDGTNWFQVIANQPKMIAEYWGEILPGVHAEYFHLLDPWPRLEASRMHGKGLSTAEHGTISVILKTTQLNRAGPGRRKAF